MEHVPAGWYPSPESSSLLQYWDGELWSDRMRPVPGAEFEAVEPLTLTTEPNVPTNAAVQRALHAGEQLLGGFEGSNGRRKQIVVATDVRIIWFRRKGLRGRFVATTIPYEDIIDARARTDKMYAPLLEITTDAETFGCYCRPLQTIVDFARFVQHRTEERPTSRTAHPPPLVETGDDNAEDDGLVAGIERLASLHRSGALSDDEFATAKARLLDGDANP